MHRQFTLALKSKADRKGGTSEIPGRVIHTADDMNDPRYERLVLFPRYERQRIEFSKALEIVQRQGGWCVNIDELYYVGTILRLDKIFINRALTQGRGNNITIMCGIQRPAAMTRFALSESTHIISFRISGKDALNHLRVETDDEFYDTVRGLSDHEFAWYYRPKQHAVFVGQIQDLAATERSESYA